MEGKVDGVRPAIRRPAFASLGGRLVPYEQASLGLLTHALNYGTAVFGGLRGYWNADEEQLFVFRPSDHFRRFIASARLLRMELATSPETLIENLKELLQAEGLHQDTYIRALAFYRDELIGVRLHDLTPETSLVAIPFGRYVDKEDGAHVTVSGWRRVSDNAIPARGKIAGAYVNSALAKSDAVLAGFDEALLLNEHGHVCEGSAENVFMVRNGVVATPPVTEDILEGITRGTVIQLLRDELGVSVVERPIDRSEIYVSDEMFFTGTGAQITSIVRVDHRPIGSGRMGTLTESLRELFFRVVRGQVPKYRSWCVPVHARVREAVAVGAAAAR